MRHLLVAEATKAKAANNPTPATVVTRQPLALRQTLNEVINGTAYVRRARLLESERGILRAAGTRAGRQQGNRIWSQALVGQQELELEPGISGATGARAERWQETGAIAGA